LPEELEELPPPKLLPLEEGVEGRLVLLDEDDGLDPGPASASFVGVSSTSDSAAASTPASPRVASRFMLLSFVRGAGPEIELLERQLAPLYPREQADPLLRALGLGPFAEGDDLVVPFLQNPKPPRLTVVAGVFGEPGRVAYPQQVSQELLFKVRPEVLQEVSFRLRQRHVKELAGQELGLLL